MPAQRLPARNFLDNEYVYCVISQRARGLSIGINMNPDKLCNFDCLYCEIDRRCRPRRRTVKIPILIEELKRLLSLIHDGRLGELGYHSASSDVLPFKEVALSGDGEPTLCPKFLPIVEEVVRLRARSHFPFFKIVLITNATALQLPGVRAGVDLLSSHDEIWAKLDGGSRRYIRKINRPNVSLDVILRNIGDLGRRRPIVIQSLFPCINGEGPSEKEIDIYIRRLRDLKESGAQISLVQVYSAHRPAMDSICSHLSLAALSRIARAVQSQTGIRAEVF